MLFVANYGPCLKARILTNAPMLNAIDANCCCTFNGYTELQMNFLRQTKNLLETEQHRVLISANTFCYGNCITIAADTISLLQYLLDIKNPANFIVIREIKDALEAIYVPSKNFLLLHSESTACLTKPTLRKLIFLANLLTQTKTLERILTSLPVKKLRKTLYTFFRNQKPAEALVSTLALARTNLKLSTELF